MYEIGKDSQKKKGRSENDDEQPAPGIETEEKDQETGAVEAGAKKKERKKRGGQGDRQGLDSRQDEGVQGRTQRKEENWNL